MIPRKSRFVQYRKINGRNYLSKDYLAYELDEISDLVWTLIDGKNSLENIALAVFNEYDVAYDVVLKDIITFINELKKNNLIINKE